MSARRSSYAAAMGALGIVLLITGTSCNKNNPVSGNNGPLHDADGNVYTTVKIGTQEWMAENLRTTKYKDGTPIPLVTNGNDWSALTTPGYCYYNNTTNPDSIKKFGVLYNWYAVNTNKLAPAGWHVPADSEWSLLANYLSGNGNSYDGSVAAWKIGKVMAATTDWSTDTTPGAIGCDLTLNNSSGFSGLPGGMRGTGTFLHIGYGGFWWSSTTMFGDPMSSGAWSRGLYYSSADVRRGEHIKCYGVSVRLVRD